MKPVVQQVKVIELLESLRYITELEAKERGTESIIGCATYKDGTPTYQDRMWSQIIQDQHGNQQFSNDSFYRFTSLGLEDVEEYGEATDEVKTFLEHFPDCVNKETYSSYILFDVSW